MNHTTIRAALGFALLTVATMAVVGFAHPNHVSKPDEPISVLGLSEIRSYKQWTRVNLTSLPLSPLSAGLCRMAMPGERIASQENPHRGKFFAVYVNDVGKPAMMSQLHPAFAEGSIIVKEKLPNQTSASPELLTVMIKREKGFNPELGDWEFLVVNGDITEIQGRGKLANCQSCHLMKPDTDFVFRTYLGDEAKRQLQ
jgi:hypothetical protein